MNAAFPPSTSGSNHRHWHARLNLEFLTRHGRTAMTRSDFFGPLRVQRPFYPETDGSAHVYLLHPPGGLVIGDLLELDVDIREQSKVVLTTPSAGKLYGAKGDALKQRQHIHLRVAQGGCLEWVPQETILFNGVNGCLTTRIDLDTNASMFAWDIVRLGRVASGETFDQGCCTQSFEVWQEKSPRYVERNRFSADHGFLTSKWGMQGLSVSGTLLATYSAQRGQIDQWCEYLDQLSAQTQNLWGVTQKEDLLIVRFMGNTISHCRRGFTYMWQQLRPNMSGKPVVMPRIWNT